MSEPSMEPRDGTRNQTLREMRAEVVEMDDGRYLIYYSWPERRGDEPAEPVRREAEAPVQEPWSPEAGPTDV